MDPLLDIQDLCFDYLSEKKSVSVMRHLSFQVMDGDFIAIVGPSGCGKSTLLDLICGLSVPADGCILYQGQPICHPRQEIGYMLQKDHLFEWRTIYRNVLLGAEIEGAPKRKRKSRRLLAADMLKRYQLWDFAAAKPSQLSGGMRQRAALIRTLVMEPQLLLLDEPFCALDYHTRLMVCDDICNIIQGTGKTAIMVTHDLAEAVSVGNRVIVMASRPSYVRQEISFDPDFVQLSPLQRRNHPLFHAYFQKLWEAFSYESEPTAVDACT